MEETNPDAPDIRSQDLSGPGYGPSLSEDLADAEKDRAHALFYGFLSSLVTTQLKTLLAVWGVPTSGLKDVLIARCFLYMEKRCTKVADGDKLVNVPELKEIFRSFVESVRTRPLHPAPKVAEMEEKIEKVKLAARIRAQKAKGSTPSKRSLQDARSQGNESLSHVSGENSRALHIIPRPSGSSSDGSRPTTSRKRARLFEETNGKQSITQKGTAGQASSRTTTAAAPVKSGTSKTGFDSTDDHLFPRAEKNKKNTAPATASRDDGQKAEDRGANSTEVEDIISPVRVTHARGLPVNKDIQVSQGDPVLVVDDTPLPESSVVENDDLDEITPVKPKKTPQKTEKKKGKKSQKQNVYLCQFVRLCLLLRDDEMCREGLMSSLQCSSKEDLQNNLTPDSFWRDDVEQRFNKSSFAPHEDVSTVVANIDPSVVGPERDAAWFKKLAEDVRAPFTKYWNKYKRSGQNDPERFPKIISDQEQRQLMVGKLATDEMCINLDDSDEESEDEADGEDQIVHQRLKYAKNMSSTGKKCLLVFTLCKIVGQTPTHVHLFRFFNRDGMKADDGDVKAAGMEGGVPEYEEPSFKSGGSRRRSGSRRKSTDSAGMSGEALSDSEKKNSIYRLINTISASRERKEKEKEEARRSFNAETGGTKQMRQHGDVMSILEQLGQVSSLLESARKQNDPSIAVLERHNRKILRKYQEMLDADSDTEQTEPTTTGRSGAGAGQSTSTAGPSRISAPAASPDYNDEGNRRTETPSESAQRRAST